MSNNDDKNNGLARPGDFGRSGTESLPITGAVRYDNDLLPSEGTLLKETADETSVECSIDNGLAAVDKHTPRMGDDRFTLPSVITGEQTIVRMTGDTVRFSDESTVVTELPGVETIDGIEIPLDDDDDDDADETLRTRNQLHLLDIELELVDDDRPIERKTVEAQPISTFDYTNQVPALKTLPEYKKWDADRKAEAKQAAPTGTFWSKLHTAGNVTTFLGTLAVVLVTIAISMGMLYSNTVRTLSAVHQPVSTMHKIVNHQNEIKTTQLQSATTIAEQVINTGVSAGSEFSNIVASTPSVSNTDNDSVDSDSDSNNSIVAILIPEHDLAPQVDTPSPQPTTHAQPPTAIAEPGPATSVVRTTGPKTVHSNAKTSTQKHQASAHKIVVASHVPRSTPKTSRPIKAKSPESLAAVQPPTAVAEPGPAHVRGEIQPAIFDRMPVIVTSANAPIYRNAHMFIHSENRHSHKIAFLQGF